MQILDIELPPEIEALHADLVESRPESELRFVRGMPAGSRFESRHTPDAQGNSEIRLAEGAGIEALTHELLHALFYRHGFPVATCSAFAPNFAGLAQVVVCATSHAAMQDEAEARNIPDALWHDHIVKLATLDEPDEPALQEASLLQAWRLADAIFLDREAVAPLEERCRAKLPQTWAVVERILQAMERSRVASGVGWRRAMVDLLTYFDAMAREHHPNVVPPLKSIAITLVLSEQQLTRDADRRIEVVPSGAAGAAFVSKQDGTIFHFRYLDPNTQKRELAVLRMDLKRAKTIDFLEHHGMPYTVDMRAGKPADAAS
jgi:hypothetical protein